MASEQVPTIYVFVAGRFGEDYSMLAVAEDGDEIAGHVSSSIAWGKHDMGVGKDFSWKHDKYKAKYPQGFRLEWVDDWEAHPVLAGLAERNRADSPA